jgi:alkanesulfonate monooxygenase SsuD/methylene tetrahydromethanopterin reductase-like flavin-dependent oxidoreductase (luciferase family)
MEAQTVLAGIATSTERIRFGAMTTTFIYRNPALVAKQAATLDVMSNGRFELGLGTGDYDADHLMTGSSPWPRGERLDRFREAAEIVDRLLRGETLTYRGNHYVTDEAVVRPLPVQQPRPPISIGANGPRLITYAARVADRWNTWGGRGLDDEELYRLTAERVSVFKRAVEAAGRDRAKVVASFYVFRPLTPWRSPDAFERVVERYAATGLDELLFPWPGFLDPVEPARQHETFREVSATIASRTALAENSG